MNFHMYTNMHTTINKKVAGKRVTNSIWGGFGKRNGNGKMMCF